MCSDVWPCPWTPERACVCVQMYDHAHGHQRGHMHVCSDVWSYALTPERARACVRMCAHACGHQRAQLCVFRCVAVHVEPESTRVCVHVCDRAHGHQRVQVRVFRCVSMHEDARDEPRMSASVTTHLVFLRQGLFLLSGICQRDQADWTISTKDPSPLHRPRFVITGVQTPLVTFCSHEFCGSELSPVFELHTLLTGIFPALC